MDRIHSPVIKTVDKITLPRVDIFHLDNEVPVYGINGGDQEVVKVELLFRAGKWYEEKNLIADFTNRMLREGTTSKSAKQIADEFDYYGANVHYSTGFEKAGVALYSLTSRVHEVLPLLYESLTEASFPESELETIIGNRKQRLKVDLEKNDFVANRHFVQALFGQKHPYGRITTCEDLDQIGIADLKSFHRQYYQASNLFIIVAGKFTDHLIQQLNTVFGNKEWKRKHAINGISHSMEPSSVLKHFTEKANAVQSAIQLGNHSINKHHPDFLKLSVLNTLLGGYFGSRLMANIREDKGYTYGIYSSLVSYPHAGFIEIAAEVGKGVRDETLQEIKFEIDRLRSEPVSSEELQMVKNYLSGKILRSVDGSLKFSEVLAGQLINGLSDDYTHRLLHAVKEITPEDMLALANKYLHFEEMYQIAVG